MSGVLVIKSEKSAKLNAAVLEKQRQNNSQFLNILGRHNPSLQGELAGRCKYCGEIIEQHVDAIEAHELVCRSAPQTTSSSKSYQNETKHVARASSRPKKGPIVDSRFFSPTGLQMGKVDGHSKDNNRAVNDDESNDKSSTVAKLPYASQCDDLEWQLRVELAAACRVFGMMAWDDLTNSLITVRLPPKKYPKDKLSEANSIYNDDVFLMAPHGLNYYEVTASSLIKVRGDGSLVSKRSAAVDRHGLSTHVAIHTSLRQCKWVMQASINNAV